MINRRVKRKTRSRRKRKTQRRRNSLMYEVSLEKKQTKWHMSFHDISVFLQISWR